MSKKKMELKNQIEVLKAEAQELIETGKVEEAKAKAAEAKNLKEQIDVMDEIEGIEGGAGAKVPVKDQVIDEEKAYRNAFLKAVRNKRLTAEDREILEVKNALTEGTDADGALILPQDIRTQINEYKRSLVDLSLLASIEPVSTLTGSRVFEKLATMTAFANITDDTADIAEMASPQFEALTYSVKKYAGWLPIPNDLLKDTDQALISFLVKWIGKKSIVTNNTLFLAVLNALNEATFADYKAIKKALNVTLDPMHAINAVILTNQDGFQYLDSLEDGNGKPLLQVDVTNPTQKLFAGKRVIVAPNSVLATTGSGTKYAPFYIGDFKEAVVKFERQGYEIASTKEGGTAFRKDRTEMRVIEREEYKAWDSAAVVRGKIDVTAVIA